MLKLIAKRKVEYFITAEDIHMSHCRIIEMLITNKNKYKNHNKNIIKISAALVIKPL